MNEYAIFIYLTQKGGGVCRQHFQRVTDNPNKLQAFAVERLIALATIADKENWVYDGFDFSIVKVDDRKEVFALEGNWVDLMYWKGLKHVA